MLGKLLRWLIDREGKGGIWESDPELCTGWDTGIVCALVQGYSHVTGATISDSDDGAGLT